LWGAGGGRAVGRVRKSSVTCEPRQCSDVAGRMRARRGNKQRGSAHRLRGSRRCEKAHREAGNTPQSVEYGGVGKEWDRSRPGSTITTTPADDPDAERMDRGESARVGFVLAVAVGGGGVAHTNLRGGVGKIRSDRGDRGARGDRGDEARA
jgi:hypothetical protein